MQKEIIYDFSIQKNMLKAALLLLKEKDLLGVSALGGGTALSSFYWNHRYSTDIDMFVYSKVDITKVLKENRWSDEPADKDAYLERR